MNFPSVPPDLFPPSYESSRQRFLSYLEPIQARWPSARLGCYPLSSGGSLSIDWIEAEPLDAKEKVLLFTLGQHGIEGYAGSAMLDLFMSEFLPNLDPRSTGLALVHAINPWGMQHLRRANASNVDLNRNFAFDERELDPTTNPAYARANSFFNPTGPADGWLKMQLLFGRGLVQTLVRMGPGVIQTALTLGQYRFPRGVYYGGTEWQEETRAVMDLYRAAVSNYGRILLLDMHTGYGPPAQLTLVNSAHEPRSSEALKLAFGYPHVAKTDASEFYSIQGDMIDYIYKLAKTAAPEKHLYATSFEFGTLGDGFLASLRALRATIFENWVHWSQTKNPNVKDRTLQESVALSNPPDPAWQAAVVESARVAFQGVLRAEGYVGG
jgi:hypothetical protein